MQQGQPWSVYSGQVLTTILCWLHFELQGTQIRQIPQELQGTQIELPRKKKNASGQHFNHTRPPAKSGKPPTFQPSRAHAQQRWSRLK